MTTVIAQDKDALENSRIVYSIISGAGGKFMIDSRTGAITTKASLDREMQDVFKVLNSLQSSILNYQILI